MNAILDRYLILSERGYEALHSQAHSTREEAVKHAAEWCEHTGDKILIFHKLMIVEDPNVKVMAAP